MIRVWEEIQRRQIRDTKTTNHTHKERYSQRIPQLEKDLQRKAKQDKTRQKKYEKAIQDKN